MSTATEFEFLYYRMFLQSLYMIYFRLVRPLFVNSHQYSGTTRRTVAKCWQLCLNLNQEIYSSRNLTKAFLPVFNVKNLLE